MTVLLLVMACLLFFWLGWSLTGTFLRWFSGLTTDRERWQTLFLICCLYVGLVTAYHSL